MKITRSAIAGLALMASLAAFPAAAADISGQWDWTTHTEGGDRPANPVFQLSGESVTGKWDASEVKGTFIGNQLKLSFPFVAHEAQLTGTLAIDGKLDGDTLTGTWTFDQYKGTFTATRKKAVNTAAAAGGTAKITGSWQCEIQTNRTMEALITITDDGGKLAGKIKAQDRELPLIAPKFENGVLSFQVEAGSMTVAFDVKSEGDLLTGTWKADGNSGPIKGKRA